MNAKVARDAMHEFLSLLGGSDTYAEEILLSCFPKRYAPAEHIVYPMNLLSPIIKRVCSNIQMKQSELDKKWCISFLQALLVLAAAGKPHAPLMRRARAKCDYVLFMHNETVCAANTQVYKETFSKVVALADDVLSKNRSAQHPSSSERNLFNEYVTTSRLSDWIRRAVIADLIKRGWKHTLSNVGKMHLNTFRGSDPGSSTSEQFARSVFTALDRRGIWSKMSNIQVTMNEVNGAALVVCNSLQSIENGTWEGHFADFVQTGALGPYFGAIEEYMRTEPEFEELGQYAWIAQCHFKKGASIADSLANAKLETQMYSVLSLSARDKLNELMRAEGLSDWIRRAVITDLINLINEEQEYKLSDRGRLNLNRFRESLLGSQFSDQLSRSVFTALDRRGIWSEMSAAGVTAGEVKAAAFVVCSSLSSIENGRWEGDFTHYALKGVFEPDFSALDEYRNNEPEFEELGQYAWKAQILYKQGLSIAESLARVKLEMEIQSGSSRILERDPDITRSEEENDRIRGKVWRCEILKGILADFGVDSLLQFMNIDRGLTGAIDANVDTVSNILHTALGFKLGEQRFKHGNCWLEDIADTDVLLIALSYKHQSPSVRLDPKTVEKIATAVCQMAENHGMSKVNIWLDAILSQNCNIADSSWAVNGLYPYLCCDVLRVVGNDNEYSDGSESSMWMQVERDCADKDQMITLRLHEGGRGFNFETGRTHYGRSTVRDRMMALSKGICQGQLIGKLASWRDDKRNLIIWAESCMLDNAPVLMDNEALQQKRVLDINNKLNNPLEIKQYLQKCSSAGFMEIWDTTGIRERVRGWTGVFELLPGLREASEEEWIPLVPSADEGFRFSSEYPGGGEMVLLGFGTFVVFVDMDCKKRIRHVRYDILKDDGGNSFEDYKDEMRRWTKGEPRPLAEDEELRWGQQGS